MTSPAHCQSQSWRRWRRMEAGKCLRARRGRIPAGLFLISCFSSVFSMCTKREPQAKTPVIFSRRSPFAEDHGSRFLGRIRLAGVTSYESTSIRAPSLASSPPSPLFQTIGYVGTRIWIPLRDSSGVSPDSMTLSWLVRKNILF